jgi:endonuclease/exonuclease/phosphatase family metal-dependent hydrolase
MKKLSAVNKVIFFINNILALLLLFSALASYIKPSSFSAAPILSLAAPVLLFVNIIFVLYWIVFGLKKQFILSLIALIISFFVSSTPYKFKSNNKSSEDGLSIMSYNVRKFNIYNWIDDINIDSKISAFISKEDPDIVLLQEYKETKNFKLKYPNYYNHKSKKVYNTRIKTYPSGLAIFSKYPIINKGSVDYEAPYTSVIFTDIVKNNDTIRFYNFHLESLGVVPDKDYFGHKNSQRLLNRLSQSFKVQQTEIETLKNHIKACKYSVILAGDMNNTAYSWVYKNLKIDLQDSFLETGSGFGKTYSFKGFPLRIDFIFTDKNINIINHKNYQDRYSDHYPIMATVSF